MAAALPPAFVYLAVGPLDIAAQFTPFFLGQPVIPALVAFRPFAAKIPLRLARSPARTLALGLGVETPAAEIAP